MSDLWFTLVFITKDILSSPIVSHSDLEIVIYALFLYPWIAVIHCCLSKHNFLECLKVGQSAKSSKSSHGTLLLTQLH